MLVLTAGAAAYFLLFRRPKDPRERERIRRLDVNERGRLADGYIIEATPSAIIYKYLVRGMEYTASQDVSMMGELIPGETERLIGPVTLKYLARNPANSIVVCENWSGLRVGHHAEENGPEANQDEG